MQQQASEARLAAERREQEARLAAVGEREATKLKNVQERGRRGTHGASCCYGIYRRGGDEGEGRTDRGARG